MLRYKVLRSLKIYFLTGKMVDAKIKDFGYNLCRKYLGGKWKKISPQHFEIERIHGGLTNHLFLCSLPHEYVNSNPDGVNKALLRLYGAFYADLSDNNVRMMEECIICGLLAEKKMAPELYGIFPEGRLEQFIPNVRALTSREVQYPRLSQQIAEHVAAFHKLKLPLSKEGTWFLDSLQIFVKEIKGLKFSNVDKLKILDEIFHKFDIDEILKYIRHVVENSQSPVFFCHNDVQPGNLLVKANEDLDEAKIRVIDFEYSCYNYRGYDIGNHFSEWIFDYNHPHYPFFTGDVTKYPSYDQKVFFVRAYLQAYNETTDVTLDEIEKVIDEADRLSLLSHFFWAMFSILQSYKSSINFGYLEYALFRMECLNHFKHFSEEKPGDKFRHDNGKIHCDV
ncbi:choline kinase alpha-like isoform X1 [Xenia sp. Carnegie-2017]|uniref:choline kinase alpha-like isoform X1 n=1 Tax=Xenia sp. Carnegie-2017 TaxID=2897299 RepID=UPI001F0340BE|nr:choline kinase alpha-like isoform X1 [Xenia sp. Carnegie-2017]